MTPEESKKMMTKHIEDNRKEVNRILNKEEKITDEEAYTLGLVAAYMIMLEYIMPTLN